MLNQTQTTIPSVITDFSEWHHGRKRYGVWVLRCDENHAVQEKVDAARQPINEYLLAPYQRQPHITLFVCGFLAEKRQYNDDFTQAQLDTQVQALEKSNIGPFEIGIGGMNSFASAPFLEVIDPDAGITRLREVLSGGADEFRTMPYRPHLTIGLYADAFQSKKVLARMAAFASEPVRCLVEKVSLATYQAEEIAGELTYEYSFWLKAKAVTRAE